MVRALLISLFLALLLVIVPCEAQAPVHFQGQANRGQEFRREIAPSLIFVLRPSEDGWNITVQPVPKPASPEGCDDFVWVVTPPYRSSNPRYLETSYGMSAREAVEWSPREFQFVLNVADCKTEGTRVERVLWPANYTDKEVSDAEAKLGTSPTAKGTFTILDSRISSKKIDWVKFEVAITFPAKR
jgi:hypothetical protein